MKKKLIFLWNLKPERISFYKKFGSFFLALPRLSSTQALIIYWCNFRSPTKIAQRLTATCCRMETKNYLLKILTKNQQQFFRVSFQLTKNLHFTWKQVNFTTFLWLFLPAWESFCRSVFGVWKLKFHEEVSRHVISTRTQLTRPENVFCDILLKFYRKSIFPLRWTRFELNLTWECQNSINGEELNRQWAAPQKL